MQSSWSPCKARLCPSSSLSITELPSLLFNTLVNIFSLKNQDLPDGSCWLSSLHLLPALASSFPLQWCWGTHPASTRVLWQGSGGSTAGKLWERFYSNFGEPERSLRRGSIFTLKEFPTKVTDTETKKERRRNERNLQLPVPMSTWFVS